MRPLSYDTETALIRRGLLAPPITCMTWQEQGKDSQICHWPDAEQHLHNWLLNPDVLLVGHNIAFDMAVVCSQWPDLVPLVFDAYDADRVTDTMIREQLLAIAAGIYGGFPDAKGKWTKPKFSLFDVAKRHSPRILNKDGWRMFYGEFRDVPLGRWPEHAKALQEASGPRLRLAEHALTLNPKSKEHRKAVVDLTAMINSDPMRCIQYPVEDAEVALECYLSQEEYAGYLHNQYEQARSAWVHQLCSAWGMRTSKEGVDRLAAETREAYEDVKARLLKTGLVRADGSRDTKAAKAHMKTVCYEQGKKIRLTEKGGVSLDADACEYAEDAVLQDYARLSELAAITNKDIPMLMAGTEVPVQTRFGLAATGRATSSKPNLQNLRTNLSDDDIEAGKQDIRGCLVPRDGMVFLQADYPGLELHTLGQSCLDLFGESRLADMLNSGVDPHLAFACNLLSVPYEEGDRRLADGSEEVKKMRKIAKVFNFGKPGGMGDRKFVLYLANNDVTLDLESVKAYTLAWKATFPEMQHLFDFAGRECSSGFGTVKLPRSRRERGACLYTAFCNTWFQGPGSDCMRRAMYLIQRACYSEVGGNLFGSRMVCEIHDEYLVETPEEVITEAAGDLERIMVVGANEYVPQVPFKKIDVVAMRKWSKKAKSRRDGDGEGRLVVWE